MTNFDAIQQPTQVPTADPATPTAGTAQIFDQGYRRYDGDRTGVAGAITSLIKATGRQALGLKRKFRHKLIPLLVVFFSFVPAIVFVGLAALLPEDFVGELPSYADYYGFVVAALFLYAAFTSSAILCEDRRTGMLGVYLSSPLDRRTYLFGKAVAFVGLLLIVTILPVLLMLIAYSLQNAGPDGFFEWLETFAKIVLAGLSFGLVFAFPSLAVASTTDRWVVATATNAAAFPASAIVTDLLVGEGDLTPHLRLLNLPGLARELTYRIHGGPGANNLWSRFDNPTWTLAAAGLAWVALSVGVVWLNYRRLLVRR